MKMRILVLAALVFAQAGFVVAKSCCNNSCSSSCNSCNCKHSCNSCCK